MLHLQDDPLDGYLPEAIAEMEQRMVSAGEFPARQAIELACEILRCRRPEGAVLAAYISMMSRVPRDLLLPSVMQALSRETHHVLPTPGALLAAVWPRLEERERVLSLARLALKRLKIAAEWRLIGLGQ